MPLYGAFFLFILANNLIGLIPGFAAADQQRQHHARPRPAVVRDVQLLGFQKHGVGYLKHFVGPIWWLVFLMLPLEIIDNFLRPLTLDLRLLMNMFADHLVLDIFTDLTKLIVPVLFYMLGTFVVRHPGVRVHPAEPGVRRAGDGWARPRRRARRRHGDTQH